MTPIEAISAKYEEAKRKHDNLKLHIPANKELLVRAYVERVVWGEALEVLQNLAKETSGV